ncbi:MAG: hypothetical protein V1886_01525 [archaeon]
MRFKRGYHLMLLAVSIIVLDFFTLGNKALMNKIQVQPAASIIFFASVLTFIIGLIKTIIEFVGGAINANDKKIEPRAISDIIIRSFIAVLLFLSAIPLLLNLITLPIIILAVVVSIYLIASKSHHLSFEIVSFILAIVLAAGFGWGLFREFKGILFYAPPLNQSLIGFFLFGPSLMFLLISTSYLLLQGIASRAKPPFFRNHPALANFSILFAIVLVFSAFVFMKNIDARPGNYFVYDSSMTKQEVLLEMSGNNFTYTLKETNSDDKPMNILRIFGNKEDLDLNSLALEGAEINDSKIIVPSHTTAKIIIPTSSPIYIITVDVENRFPPQGFNFWK